MPILYCVAVMPYRTAAVMPASPERPAKRSYLYLKDQPSLSTDAAPRSLASFARHRRDHVVDPCFVAADRSEFRAELGLGHTAGSDNLQILFVPVEVGDDLETDPIGIEEVEGMDRWRKGQERPRGYGNPIRLQSFQYLVIALWTAHEGDMLHRAYRIVINLGNASRILKEGKQAVAAHIEKIMGDVRVRRRTDPVRRVRTRRARGRSQPVHERHTQHAHIKIERHPHVVGDESQVMDPTQRRLEFGYHLARSRFDEMSRDA